METPDHGPEPSADECEGCRRSAEQIAPDSLGPCRVTNRRVCTPCWLGIDPRRYGYGQHTTGRKWANQKS